MEQRDELTVDWAIEHYPLTIGDAMDLLLLRGVTVGDREDAVRPLVRHAVKLTVPAIQRGVW